MKISFKGDYTLKVILDLTELYNRDRSAITQIKEIARRKDIPEKFLEQIVTTLKQANYLKTIRGSKGGITLSKPPEQITIGEIIRLVDGTTAPIACVSHTQHHSCGFENCCAFKDIFVEVRSRINDVVDNITFQEVYEKHVQRQSSNYIGYGI